MLMYYLTGMGDVLADRGLGAVLADREGRAVIAVWGLGELS